MMEPMSQTGGDLSVALIGVAVVGVVLGFAWIRRITRGPDDDPSNWRSRR